MSRRHSLTRLALLTAALWLAGGASIRGEGPLLVGGPPCTASGCIPNSVSGQPFRWVAESTNILDFNSSQQLSYWVDPDSPTGLVPNAFTSWQNVATTSINFKQADTLSTNVTSTNAMAVLNALNDCSTLPGAPAGGIAEPVTVIYDSDGTIFKNVLGADPSVAGEATALCPTSDAVNNTYNRGLAIINGGCTSGGNPCSQAQLQAVMTHEFGHLIGLDHAQINVDCMQEPSPCTSSELSAVPLMFPVLLSDNTTPRLDDQAGVSVLYPGTVNNPPTKIPFSSMGGISGQVFFTDGVTPAQGFNVIACSSLSSTSTDCIGDASSNVSGYLFTEDAGNAVVPGSTTETPFGSRDQTLIGVYNIPGLPPGSYTIQVEAINTSGSVPFTGGSSVGPIGDLGFQFVLPSILPAAPPCADEFLASPIAVCPGQGTLSQVSVTAGTVTSTGTNVVLIATPPRFDAWED